MMPDIIVAFIFGIVFGFLGSAFILGRKDEKDSPAAPLDMASAYREQVQALSAQNMLREMQLAQRRAEVEFLELQARQQDLFRVDRNKTLASDSLLIQRLGDYLKEGIDATPTGGFR